MTFPKRVFIAAFFLFLIGAGIGLYALLHPELPGNYEDFRTHLGKVVAKMEWTLMWTVVWAALALAACLSEQFWKRLCRPIMWLPGILTLAIWGLWPCLAPAALDPTVQYDNRVLDMLVPISLIPVALISCYRPAWIRARINRLICMAAVLLIAQSLWQICATIRWRGDIAQLQTILKDWHGVVPLHHSPLSKTSIEGHEYVFDWTWPCLSIALAPEKNIHSLVCSELYLNPDYRNLNLWQPFNPLNASDLPDLRHFGITFTNFVSAVQQQQAKPGQ